MKMNIVLWLIALVLAVVVVGSAYMYFSPGVESDANKFTNIPLGFTIMIPEGTEKTGESNVQISNPSVSFKGPDLEFTIRYRETTVENIEDFNYFEFESKEKGKFGGQSAVIFKEDVGYCDGSNCGHAFVAYSTLRDGTVVTIDFTGNTSLDLTERMILESFTFIK